MSKRNETVLCYIEKDNKYLMLYRNKKEHDINKNKYIGIGGHLEENETKEEALIREVFEETGLRLTSFKYHGTIFFTSDDLKETMYLFTSSSFTGSLKECNEGTLLWVDKDKLDELNMWEGDKYFLDLIKNDATIFEMELIYKNDVLISHNRLK